MSSYMATVPSVWQVPHYGIGKKCSILRNLSRAPVAFCGKWKYSILHVWNVSCYYFIGQCLRSVPASADAPLNLHYCYYCHHYRYHHQQYPDYCAMEVMELPFVLGLFDGTIGIISQAAITLVLWYGGKLVFEGHVTAGILTCKYQTKHI